MDAADIILANADSEGIFRKSGAVSRQKEIKVVLIFYPYNAELFFTHDIYADGYIVFIFLFVCMSVCPLFHFAHRNLHQSFAIKF